LKKMHLRMAVLGLGVFLACSPAARSAQDSAQTRWTLEGVLAMMDKSASDFRSLTANMAISYNILFT